MHIKRQLFAQVQNELKRKEVSILLGPRQVGKTYLLLWLKKQLKKENTSSKYFNLENPEHLLLFNRPQEELFKLLTQSGKVIFIDEFHYLKNASQIFKAIFDSNRKIKIFASGSSSIEIHKHLKESLAGRRRIIHVPPLSFQEIKQTIKRKADDYYPCFGGLPGALKETSKDERINMLNEMLQAYLLKDIRSLIKEENMRAFNMLLYLLAQNQGSLISVDGLARKIGLSSMSIHRYLDILIATYVVKQVTSYSRNIGNELKKSRKLYLYDLGMRNMLLKDFRQIDTREDKGVILETSVLLNILQGLKPNEDVHFWRTRDGKEVDFVFLKDRQPVPIEVKSKINKLIVPDGIKAFIRRYPEAKIAIVYNKSTIGKIRYENTDVIFSNWQNASSENIREYLLL